MNKIRVLLADDNPSILELLEDYLSQQEEIEVVGTAQDGGALLTEIREKQPEIVVADIIMPRCDGFTVLEEIQNMDAELRPKVIVLTGLARDDFIARAIRLGASYYMVKPFDLRLLCARITEIARAREASREEPLSDAAPQAKSADEQITNLFLTLGIPAHIKGYVYLREAVRMVLEDRDILNRITKELYPGVARRFDTSASKVERAMRHAIEVAWSRGRLETVNRMYGYRVFDPMDKPTNGEFISCIAEKIALRETA